MKKIFLMVMVFAVMISEVVRAEESIQDITYCLKGDKYFERMICLQKQMSNLKSSDNPQEKFIERTLEAFYNQSILHVLIDIAEQSRELYPDAQAKRVGGEKGIVTLTIGEGINVSYGVSDGIVTHIISLQGFPQLKRHNVYIDSSGGRELSIDTSPQIANWLLTLIGAAITAENESGKKVKLDNHKIWFFFRGLHYALTSTKSEYNNQFINAIIDAYSREYPQGVLHYIMSEKDGKVKWHYFPLK